jgi:hypothetical protein
MFALPVLLISSFTLGIRDGYRDLRSSTPTLLLQSNNKNSAVIPLRLLEKGLLVREPSKNQIEFHLWSRTELISSSTTLQEKSYGCQWLGIGCRK